MIVSEKDPVGKKIKWYLICLLGNVAILVLVGGTLPFLVIEYFNKIAGGILFLPCFWLAGKLCDSLENYIGIACSLQNPNRHNLVRVFSDWSPPWIGMSKGKSMSLNTDDLKKFEQGVPEKISLSGSFDRNVPRNIRLMTSSAEFFRIDSAEKKLSVCLDWRCTLRKNIIEFMVVVVQATLLISIGYSWFYALLIAGIAGIGGLLYFRFQHQSLAKLNIPCVQVMEMQNGILRLFKNDDLIFMQQDTDFRKFDLKDIQCFLCVAATTIYYNHTQWKNDAVWKILYAVRQDSTLECIMFTGDCGTKFYRILAKKCGKKLVTCRQKNIKYCDDQSVIK